MTYNPCITILGEILWYLSLTSMLLVGYVRVDSQAELRNCY